MEFPMKSSENLHLILETKFGDNPLVVGNKAILKTDVTKKQSTPNFLKINYFLTPDTHTYVSAGGKKYLFLRGRKSSFF